MKILRIISSVDPKAGGPVEGIRQITPALARLGHTTDVVTLDDPAAPWLTSFPAAVHALGPARTGYAYAPRLAPWLRENASRYDVVIVHGLWQHTGFGAWQALRESGTPYFVYAHGMLDPWFKHAYPLKHLKKCLYWAWAERRVLRDARAVLFTSDEERRQARLSFAGYECHEQVVGYGTSSPPGDCEMLRRRFFGAHPTLEGKRLLLFLSRIHPKKGCDLLLRAFAQVAQTDPSLHLIMAGPDGGAWQVERERLADALGIAGRITWTGMLMGEDKWGAFHAADAFILPSHQENFGIAVAEALACGLPVLISDKVNIWREIQEDGAGFVADDTEAGTTRLLHDWLAQTPGEAHRMRRNARCCFLTRFEIEAAAEGLMEMVGAHLADQRSRGQCQRRAVHLPAPTLGQMRRA